MSESVSLLAIALFGIAFLPSIIAAISNRTIPTLAICALNLAAVAGLVAFIVPGVVIWLVALFLAMWVANRAKLDKQHREMMKAIEQGRRP